MIRVTHIDKYYNRGKGSEVHALRDVNLTIQQGERIGIIGTSGSGIAGGAGQWRLLAE